jgi:hypothetical protein
MQRFATTLRAAIGSASVHRHRRTMRASQPGAFMKRLLCARPLLAAAVACGALAAASAAHARSDVVFSIGIQAPFGYEQPAPVYVQPQPVYVQPQPVYVESQPVYVQQQPMYVQQQPMYVQPQPVYYNGYHHRWHHRHGGWGDADRDGVPNRYDRAPYDRYRR